MYKYPENESLWPAGRAEPCPVEIASVCILAIHKLCRHAGDKSSHVMGLH